ncbi:MAG: M1 family metallopeptidase [Acidobacteriota bacterium]
MKKLFYATLSLLSASVLLNAQQPFMPRNVQRAFANQTRSPDGRPGKNYWQNTAKYDIKITVAPPSRTITGTEDIIYTNNSPNTLENIVFRLELNSHVPGSPREVPQTNDYLTSGVHIDEYQENGAVKKWAGNPAYQLTDQRIKLDTKLAPNQTIKLSFKWHYDMSVESGREGAIDPSTFFIAYYYPRVAVYDDTDGWDTNAFMEGHEFYNDFNDYTYQVTAPKNFIVWGTGDLLNPDEVLQPKYAKRLKDSFTSDDVTTIASADELASKSVTVQSDALTWKWKADNVSDVALAVSDHFIWDAGSVVVDKATKRRASVQAAYNIEAKDFQKMVEYAKHALDWISNNYPGIPYPYQKTTVVRGFADMEYPMMVNDSSQQDGNFTRFIVEHEILHTYFPFYMGINERRYGFMDEGWTTAFEYLIGREDLGNARATQLFQNFRVASWIKNPAADADLPIMLPGDAMQGLGFSNNEYGKGALGYLALKDLLGDAEFKRCLHEFIGRWHGKHTLPWDMFNSFNNASGKDLNWFFNNWYFSYGYIDLGIGGVTGNEITIKNIGGMPAPADLMVTYDDGTTETLHQTPAIWQANPKEARVILPSKKTVKSLVLAGGIWMDANEADNRWEAK